MQQWPNNSNPDATAAKNSLKTKKYEEGQEPKNSKRYEAALATFKENLNCAKQTLDANPDKIYALKELGVSPYLILNMGTNNHRIKDYQSIYAEINITTHTIQNTTIDGKKDFYFIPPSTIDSLNQQKLDRLKSRLANTSQEKRKPLAIMMIASCPQGESISWKQFRSPEYSEDFVKTVLGELVQEGYFVEGKQGPAKIYKRTDKVYLANDAT
jgi:hypothetical protein